MARDAADKMRRSPNGDHAMVKRNQSGTVQMTTATSASDTGFTATSDTNIATTTLTDPGLVAFTSCTLKLSSGGTVAASATPFTLTISRDGTSLTNTTGATTTATLSLTTTTHTSPLNHPSYTLKGQVAGGSVTVTHNLSREERWA